MEKITLCGDNCLTCPRYLAQTEEQLQKAAELWHRVGWRETVVPPAEMRCGGCTSHKVCTYRLVECTLEKGVAKCSQCPEFPCGKIQELLARSTAYQQRCREVCTPQEYASLEAAFFHKEENLRK